MKEGYIPTTTLGGLEYFLQPGCLQHEVVWESFPGLLPPLVHTDERSLKQDIQLVERLLKRDPRDIGAYALNIVGRSIVIPEERNAPVVCGVPFDAIQISGWGYNPLEDGELGSEPTQEVFLPSDGMNYRKLRPHQSATEVLEGGKIIKLAWPFLFPGAYIEDEIITKVGAELGMWYLLDEIQRGGKLPFISAIPIMIGRYPELKDNEGRPAYYYASRVPYQGGRNGLFTAGMKSEDIWRALSGAVYAPRGLRSVHDELGLTHNQMGMGNFRAGRDMITFLADLATLTKLDTTPVPLTVWGETQLNPYLARGSELGKILLGFYTMKEGLSPIQFLNVLSKSIQFYLMTYCFPSLHLTPQERKMFGKVIIDPADPSLSFALSLSYLENVGIFSPSRDLADRSDHSMVILKAWQTYVRDLIT